MKSRFLLFIALFFASTLFSTRVIAQSSVSEYDEDFEWTNKTETKTIFVDIKSGADQIRMSFEGNISKGNLLISAYDPNGNKVGGFSLSTAKSEGQSAQTISGGGQNININNSDGASSISISSGKNGSATSKIEVGKSKSKSKSKNKSKTKSKNKDRNNVSVVSTSQNEKGAKGVMTKLITEPEAGKWKFVFEINDVSGRFSAEIEQD